MAATEENDNSASRIPFVTFHHPDNQPYFKEIATAKKVVREGRANIDVSCAQCLKLAKEADLLRCSRCKTVWYCSKDCQKQHWSVHKKGCKETSSSIPKILSGFVANPVLHHHLQLLFIIEYKLDETPRSDTVFLARCDVAIEPADMSYIMQLVLGRLSPAEEAKGTEGMLQVKAFVPTSAPIPGTTDADAGAGADVDPVRLEVWKNTKKGQKDAQVGVVDFKMRGVEQTMPFGVLISDDAIARVRAGAGFEIHSALLGGGKTVPLSCTSCFDFINTHIRSDKRNQLRLRTHMTKEDIDKMRGSDDDKEDG